MIEIYLTSGSEITSLFVKSKGGKWYGQITENNVSLATDMRKPITAGILKKQTPKSTKPDHAIWNSQWRLWRTSAQTQKIPDDH